MPIFVLKDTGIMLEDIGELHCDTLENAEEVAKRECTSRRAVCYEAPAKKLRFKRAGFGRFVEKSGFTTFVFESGSTMLSSRSVESVTHKQADIFARGLPAPDEFQQHAIDTVSGWGLEVFREFSQEYGERGADQVKHLQGHVYSPPTVGWVGIPPGMHTSFNRMMNYNNIPATHWECHVDCVIKIAIKHEHADFNDPVAYHGFCTQQGAPLPSQTWRGSLQPLTLEATNGFSRKGCVSNAFFPHGSFIWIQRLGR